VTGTDPDVWSPRAMRTVLAVLALAPGGYAGAALAGVLPAPTWLIFTLIAVAVVLICAAITPAFRQPRP
jgi:hypothetical protein